MTAATVDAMDRKVPIILGGWLPGDEVGRRTGKPDMLMLDGDGYLPVDVKLYTLFHETEHRPVRIRLCASSAVDRGCGCCRGHVVDEQSQEGRHLAIWLAR